MAKGSGSGFDVGQQVLALSNDHCSERTVPDEQDGDVTLRVVNPTGTMSGRKNGDRTLRQSFNFFSTSQPNYRHPAIMYGSVIAAVVGIAIFYTTLFPRVGPKTSVDRICGMIYVENLPAQEGTVRILRTGRSDNLRVLSGENPGYFEFPQSENSMKGCEFRIDIDGPLDLAPVVVFADVHSDGTPFDIHLEIPAKSTSFPRKRYKDLSPINDDVPPLNRMAILAYIGRDDEANRLADEIESHISQMDNREKYVFFTRRGFCHWQASEYKQAATYYSQAMDISVSDPRHVVLAAESVRQSAAGIHFTEELGVAQGWVDECREQLHLNLGEKSRHIPNSLLNITAAKLAIAMGKMAHGENLLVHSFAQIRDSEEVGVETRFATCIEILSTLLLTRDVANAKIYIAQSKRMVDEFPEESRRKTWAAKVAAGYEGMYEVAGGRLSAAESKLTAAIEFILYQYPEDPSLAFLFLEARSRTYQGLLKNDLAINDILRCIDWAKRCKELSFLNERYLAIWRERYARILLQQAERSTVPARGYSEALQAIEKSLVWAELQQPQEERLLNSFKATQSSIYFMQNKLDEALALIEPAIEWASQAGGAESLMYEWKAQRAPIYSWLARRTNPFNRSMLEQAIEDYSDSIQGIQKLTNDDRELAICLSAKSRVHQLLAHVDPENRVQHLNAAITDINNSLSRFERVFSEGTTGSIYMYIGLKATILSDIGKYSEAKMTLDRAFELYEASVDQSPSERIMLQRYRKLLDASQKDVS